MMTFTPRALAPLANASTASGVRWAERAFTSKGISLSSNHLHAFSITGKSLVLPMIILTKGFISIMYYLYNFKITKRSEEHTSELQSRQYLVCRLLLEKQKIRHV